MEYSEMNSFSPNGSTKIKREIYVDDDEESQQIRRKRVKYSDDE